MQNNIIGERIRKLRKKNDLTLKQLAEKIGLNLKTISNYETGEIQPSLISLISLADIFDVTLDYLVGRTDVKNPLTKPKYKVGDKVTTTFFNKENGEVVELLHKQYNIITYLIKTNNGFKVIYEENLEKD